MIQTTEDLTLELARLEQDLAFEKHFLDYYKNNVGEEHMDFAMKLADASAKSAYDDKMKRAREIRKELTEREEIINFHLTRLETPSGLMTLDKYICLMNKLKDSLSSLMNDIKDKRNEEGLAFHNTSPIHFMGTTPGSLNIRLGVLRNEGLFKDDDTVRHQELFYLTGKEFLRVLNSINKKKPQDRLDSWSEKTTFTFKNLYTEIKNQNLDMDAHWLNEEKAPIIHVPHENIRDITHTLNNYYEKRLIEAANAKEQIITGTFVEISLEKGKFRFLPEKRPGTNASFRAIEVLFDKEKTHPFNKDINYLAPVSHTIRIHEDGNRKNKVCYVFDGFKK